MNGTSPAYEILVVDDDELLRRALLRYLSQKGAQALGAADGKQALELAGVCDFATLLVDLQMPGLCGRDLVRRLRELQPAARIFVMSGCVPSEQELEDLRAAGMEDFLAKPLAFEQLHQSVLRPRRA